MLHGVAAAVVGCGLTANLQAQTLTTLASFDGTDGSEPGPVVQGLNGNLYGTTYWLGASNGGVGGTAFQVSLSGSLSAIYHFCAELNCTDGDYPRTGLLLAANGDFYGTTGLGGTDNHNWGTFFKITTSGELTTLYNFCPGGNCADGGGLPIALLEGRNGNFYGIAQVGGPRGGGTLFEITPQGAIRPVFGFCGFGCPDGSEPSGVAQGSNGNLYGTTSFSGLHNAGTVFEISPAGQFRTIYSFCSQEGCPDGEGPTSLVQASDGNLYGTTLGGGAFGSGTIFRITPTGQLKTLHSFNGVDGAYATEPLIQANDGNLYGTSFGGGSTGGTIFEISLQGSFTLLFTCGDVCGYPSSLFQASDGLLYGTSSASGSYDDGTVFSLNNNLAPLVGTVPVAGKVGTPVFILGNNLTGSTSVTFNGVAAVFTVESDTYITATVPAGATTGTVSVETRTGTLNSNPQFVVSQ